VSHTNLVKKIFWVNKLEGNIEDLKDGLEKGEATDPR